MKTEVITLNKSEQSMIDSLPENLRESVKAEILKTKTAKESVRTRNKNEFGVTVNANGVLVIRGLGNRFPLGLRPDMWKVLFANADKINQVAATIPAKQ